MKLVNLEMVGAVAVITVDNPPVNALSQGVRQGLYDAITAANDNDACRGVVIVCAGRTFIAGADINEFGKPPQPPSLPDVVHHIESCTRPVVAAIHGTALGGGFEVAMACHYRIATDSAAIGLPEVNLGLLPGASGTQRLPRLIGAQAALDIMLAGKPVKAGRALELGAIDRIAAGAELTEAAVEYASELESAGPRRIRDMQTDAVDASFFDETRERIRTRTRGLLAPGKIVDCVEAAVNLPFDEGLAKERAAFLECLESPQSDGLRHAFFAERQVNKVPGIDKNTAVRECASVAVIGAGTMGAGIAYSALTAGMNVTLLDNNEDGLKRGKTTVEGLYAGGVKRGKLTEDAAHEGLGRFETSLDYEAIGDVDLVIEAVFESMEIKKEVFTTLDRVMRPGAILATNTSTLSIDDIAAATSRPQDVIGLHFFSPAHIMRLLEIVRGEKSAPDVIATSLALAKRLRKIGVVVGNCFGFVGNRMLYSYGRENQLLLLEGASPQYIDKTLTDWGMAMGPNAVGDLAGLDVGYKVRQERTDLPDDPRFYRIADLLAEMGRFGQKTGKGTYVYREGSRDQEPDPEVEALISAEAARLGIEQRDIAADEIVERCIYGLIVEGANILEEGIAIRSSDIDVVWMNGYGFPRYRGGPMHYADTLGLENVLATVKRLNDRFGDTYWKVPDLLAELAASGRRFADFSN